MLREIGNFGVASFGLGLREVAPSNMRRSDAFSNTVTGRMRSTCVERIAARYKRKVFEATLPICGELLPYVLCATHSIRLGNWAGYGATALVAQKNSHDFVPEAYVLRVLGSMPCHKRLETK
jgi:hypothetical protein